MGCFIAEPLGEQAIGFEGSSRPALRTYLLGYILRKPQSTTANLLEDVGEGEGALGDGLVHASNLLRTTRMIYKSAEVAVPQVQYNTRRVRLLEAIKP